MTESGDQILSLLPKLIQHTLHQLPSHREIQRESNEEKQLREEVEELFTNRHQAMQVLESLFPEGIPIGPLFFERLDDLHMRLGWGELSHRATGLFLSVAVNNLPEESAEILLKELPAIKNHTFFQALESLAILFDERELRPGFASEWFPGIVHRIGNDLASAGFWKPLAKYCEKHPENSLEILRRLFAARDEPEIAVGAHILGMLRTVEMNEATSTAFCKVEAEFLNAQTVNARLVHHRSWMQTAQRGRLSRADLECLTDRMKLESGDHCEQAFWIVCRIISLPASSPDCFRFGFDWLRSNVSPAVGPTAKYSVVDFATELADKGQWEGEELILALQPIPTEDRGTWQRLEAFLVRRLETDTEAFSKLALQLARRNAREWLRVMQEPRAFDWLLLEMQKRNLGTLVGELLLSVSSASRRLGLFFLHKLEKSSVPQSLFDNVSEDKLRLIFYEHQRSSVFGEATARLLILLVPKVEQHSQSFQDEFYEELLFQAKNYAGACREAFKRKADDYPILKTVLTNAERYFDTLRELRQSSIAAMEVPGYNDAKRLHDRRFADEVSKGSEKASVFAQFAKKVHLLYAKQWSFFRDGKLSQPSQLTGFSASMELPRFEQLDPEGMVLRRLYASAQIALLSEKLNRESQAHE